MTRYPVAPDTYLRSRLTGDIALVASVTRDGHAMILLPGETSPIDCPPSRIGPTGSTNPEHLWHIVPTPHL